MGVALQTIGLVMSDVTNPFQRRGWHGGRELTPAAMVVPLNSDEDPAKERDLSGCPPEPSGRAGMIIALAGTGGGPCRTGARSAEGAHRADDRHHPKLAFIFRARRQCRGCAAGDGPTLRAGPPADRHHSRRPACLTSDERLAAPSGARRHGIDFDPALVRRQLPGGRRIYRRGRSDPQRAAGRRFSPPII